jgi:hypothetical protein
VIEFPRSLSVGELDGGQSRLGFRLTTVSLVFVIICDHITDSVAAGCCSCRLMSSKRSVLLPRHLDPVRVLLASRTNG